MQKPTIHTGGTSRSALEEGYINAGNAIRAAIKALEEAEPNGRDYYPQGPDAYSVARREHIARLDALGAVYRDMEALLEHLDA
jgi:septation ring formation regulator EzrA